MAAADRMVVAVKTAVTPVATASTVAGTVGKEERGATVAMQVAEMDKLEHQTPALP